MYISEIDINNITDETIKDVLFDTPQKDYVDADCLIVFGSHIKPMLDERLRLVIDILKTKRINKILLTGGVGLRGDFNESEYMFEVLVNQGIDKNMILLENKSKTTEENITNSIEILKSNNLLENKRLVLASSQSHLKRVGMEVKKQLENYNIEFIYEYPKESINSYENTINDDALRLEATKEIKRIIRLINSGYIDDEKVLNIEGREKICQKKKR